MLAHANEVAGRDVAEHGIGDLKPQGRLLDIAGKEIGDEICNVGDLAQFLCYWLGDVCVEAHRGFGDLRDLA